MENKKLATIQNQTFTPEQIELIKNTVAKGATNDELKIFLYTAERTGLDPIIRQIYFVKRKVKNADGTWREQMTIQTGIDGFRTVAQRSNSLAGIDDATYDVENATHPNKATVAVYRIVKNMRVAFVASARWSEYAPTGTNAFMWTKMPYGMLAKCAEALALRKAFPNDLSGLLSTEEMHQADNSKIDVIDVPKSNVVDVTTPPPQTPINTPQVANSPTVAKTVVDTKAQIDTVKKEKIKSLLAILEPLLTKQSEVQAYIRAKTGFDVLKPEFHDMIITRLTTMVREQQENEISVEDVEREFSGEDKKIMDALTK